MTRRAAPAPSRGSKATSRKEPTEPTEGGAGRSTVREKAAEEAPGLALLADRLSLSGVKVGRLLATAARLQRLAVNPIGLLETFERTELAYRGRARADLEDPEERIVDAVRGNVEAIFSPTVIRYLLSGGGFEDRKKARLFVALGRALEARGEKVPKGSKKGRPGRNRREIEADHSEIRSLAKSLDRFTSSLEGRKVTVALRDELYRKPVLSADSPADRKRGELLVLVRKALLAEFENARIVTAEIRRKAIRETIASRFKLTRERIDQILRLPPEWPRIDGSAARTEDDTLARAIDETPGFVK